MHHGTASATARDDELQRVRESLYQRSPPPGAVERYRELVGDRGVPVPATPVEQPTRVPRRRRVRLVAAVVVAVAALVVGAAGVLRARPPDPSQAQPLIAGGPAAVADQEAIDGLLQPGATRSDSLVRAIRGSGLPQLDVWDARDAGVWLQQGRGPLSRRFDGPRWPLEVPRPFSIVVRCEGSAPYRWTVRGTTEDRAEVHVLETAGASCGPVPTVATFTRPSGAVVRAFELRVAAGVRWGMVFVFPVDD